MSRFLGHGDVYLDSWEKFYFHGILKAVQEVHLQNEGLTIPLHKYISERKNLGINSLFSLQN